MDGYRPAPCKARGNVLNRLCKSRGKGYWAGRMSRGWKSQTEDACISERSFRLITVTEPLNGLPKESSPKAGSLCSVLMEFTLPILLTKLLHWTKGNFRACRVYSGRVFCSESNISFSPLPKEFCCSTRCAGTNNFQLLQASFDLCILAFCKTNLKMKRVEPSKS